MPTETNKELCFVATWFNGKHFLLERERNLLRFKKLMKLIRLSKTMEGKTTHRLRVEVREAPKVQLPAKVCGFCGMDHLLFLDESFSTAAGYELLTHSPLGDVSSLLLYLIP